MVENIVQNFGQYWISSEGVSGYKFMLFLEELFAWAPILRKLVVSSSTELYQFYLGDTSLGRYAI